MSPLAVVRHLRPASNLEASPWVGSALHPEHHIGVEPLSRDMGQATLFCDQDLPRRLIHPVPLLRTEQYFPRNSAGNPDSPKVVIFLATIIYVTVGS